MLAACARRLAACALLALAAAGAAWGQPCSAPQDIASATRFAAIAQAPESATTVTVPDRLPLELRSERVQLRYDIDVSSCANAPAAALWVFRVGAPYSITADGAPLALMSANAMAATGSGSRRRISARPAEAGVYNGRIPALYALPAGARTVSIVLETLPYMPSGMVRAATGPTHMLLPVHTHSVRSVVGYADAASGVVLVIGLLALLLWLPRRRDLNLLWLALACGLWGARGLVYFNNTVPGHPLLFEQLNPVDALLAAATIAAAALHLLMEPPRRRAAVRALAGMTAAVLCCFVAAELAGRGAVVARTLAQVTGTGFIVWLGAEVWRRRGSLPARHSAVMLGCIVALLSCVLHDLLVVAGVRPATSDSLVFWGFVVVLVGFSLMSGEYVVATLNRAERSNEELELHVARKSMELEHSYIRLRESEQDAARAQERERLLRDMHDGLGAHLMTALRGVERGAMAPGQVAQSLQESLDELRMLMDSADMGHYLPGALGAWRNRWDARLAAAGVALDWRIDESVDSVQQGSQEVLQVMRILQEAATNVVKHSQARRMCLTARVDTGENGRALRIAIEDDGIGPGEPGGAGARGLKNMHYRAQQIGGTLEVAAVPAPGQGCRVALRVPLP